MCSLTNSHPNNVTDTKHMMTVHCLFTYEGEYDKRSPSDDLVAGVDLQKPLPGHESYDGVSTQGLGLHNPHHVVGPIVERCRNPA